MPTLRDAATREAYLEALHDCGNYSRAAVAVGIDPAIANNYRSRTPDFRAQCAAAREASGAVAARPFVRWTAARKQMFLDAFAETGNATAAALAAGTTLASVMQRRRTDAAFAADWALARQVAAQLVLDRLFDGALNGFRRIETTATGTRTIVWQAPHLMMKLANQIGVTTSRYRMIELNPGLVDEARRQVEGRISREVAEGVAEARREWALQAAAPASYISDNSAADSGPARQNLEDESPDT